MCDKRVEASVWREMSKMIDVKVLVILVILGHVSLAQQKYKLCVPLDMTTQCENLQRADSEVTCVLVQDSTDCALKMKIKEVDFARFDTEQALVASNLLSGSDFVVVGEVREEEKRYEDFAFTSVAVARRSSVQNGQITSSKELKLCHPGVGRTKSGWTDRVLKALDEKRIDTVKDGRKCDEWRSTLDNEIASIAGIWGPSCRPGRWSLDLETDKRLKEDYTSLCELCSNKAACSYGDMDSDPHKGALECLQKGGDVAFVSKQYAYPYIQSMNITGGSGDWTLICSDLSLGTNASSCVWDRQPWPPIISRKEVSEKLSVKLNEWLRPTEPRELGVTIPTPRREGGWITALQDIMLDDYEIYESARPIMDLTSSLRKGRKIPDLNQEIQKACRGPLRWCSMQERERSKCDWMSYAALVAGVVPPIKCFGAENGFACAKMVNKHEADLVITNIDETHRTESELKMDVNKFVETNSDRHRSVVVVIKSDSTMRNITDMEEKKTCFPIIEGIAYGAFLRESMQVRALPPSCPYPVAVDEYLGDSCIPGANRDEENPPGVCALCQENSAGGVNPFGFNKPPNKCAAHEGNLFFGDSGALRCLHSGGGDVAWLELRGALEAIKNQTVPGIKEEDFKVLCKSGQTTSLSNGLSCSLATVPAGAAIMRDQDTLESTREINNTLSQLDGLFGLMDGNHPKPTFHMYRQFNGTKGLIFPEGTVGMLEKGSKNVAVDAYIGLTALVPRPCGEYSSAITTIASLKVILAILAIKTLFL